VTTPAPTGRPGTVPALDRAVRALCDPQRRQITRLTDSGTLVTEWATVQPLLVELRVACGGSGESKSGAHGRGGGLPVDLDMLDLLDRIGVTVLDWTGYAGLTRRGTLAPDMRQLAAHTWPDVAEGERLARILASLASASAARLAGETVCREIRNAPCPACEQGSFLREDDLGENVRAWPLRAVFSDREDGPRLIRYIECQRCASYWWRGEEMGQLHDALAATASTGAAA
jgi:hypothetical protein